ncbi:sensor histidine kinase [Methylobrevis pamukkalensis]|uniref:sensor histidine kinase n=1 Tax=Methylobrevis pamukkalensis TaxID=1439726 RepID=UPI0008461078|nr:sensor histidine kinase [Methylobrevis pamukkalensis]
MFTSLRSRIFLILIGAVVPPAVVFGAIAWHNYDLARQSGLASIAHNVELVASRVDAVAIGAGQIASTLAGVSSWMGGTGRSCAERLDVLLSTYRGYSGVAVYSGGTLLCEARSTLSPPSATSVPSDEIAGLSPGDTIVRSTASSAGDAAYWVAARPEDNAYSVAVTISPSYLAELLAYYRDYPSSRADLVNAAGQVIAQGPTSLDPGMWPRHGLALADGSLTTVRPSLSGSSFVYSARRLKSFDLWLVTASLESDVLSQPRTQLMVSTLAPLALLFIASLAIWFGLDRSVLRWVYTLGGANRAFARGETEARLKVGNKAPAEFVDLAASFNALVDRIAERTEELEAEVEEKGRYLRELHHRVKNNLQVIASLLSLQKRALPPDQRGILRFPEERVNAMSAVYRTTYANSETGSVSLGPVIREVIGRLQDVCGASRATLDLSIAGEDVRVHLDAAVPVAMLLAELLPDYLDGAVRTGIAVVVNVEITPTLLVIDISGSPEVQQHFFKLSRRFVESYLRQLDARMDESTPGHVRIDCPLDAHRADAMSAAS